MRKKFFFLMVMWCSVMAVAQNTNQAPVWTCSYNLYDHGSSNYLYHGDPFELVDDQKAFRASHVSTEQPGDNSLLKIGKQWNEYYTNGHYEGSMVYIIDGDSLINGERYFTVGALLIDQWTGDTISKGRLGSLLCERGQRIFCRDTSGERLLYDFGLDAGEKAEDGESRVTEVTAVDTIRVTAA